MTVTMTATLTFANNAVTTDTMNLINTAGLPVPVSSPEVSIQGQFFMTSFNGSANFGVLNFYNTGDVALVASPTANIVFTPPSGSATVCSSVSSPAVAPYSSAPVKFSCSNVVPGEIITVTATLPFANSATSTMVIDVEVL
jgi:hypothetical protein